MTDDRWRDVAGYEGKYQVSRDGDVRSLDRVDAAGRAWRGRTMRQAKLRDHPIVGLYRNGTQKIHYVHALVLTAFCSARPAGFECCHADGDPSNNRLENLRWDTRSANAIDTVRHGRNANAAKTRCKNGHDFSPDNIYWTRAGKSRRCRTCRAYASAKRHAA